MVTRHESEAEERGPRPFLRWAGSKRWLVSELIGVVPAEYGTYIEPFLGGGSLFFRLEPERAVLNDALAPLVDCYRSVRDAVGVLLSYLEPLRPDRELFDEVKRRHSRGRHRRSADFIYLNRTAWNALYRVNSSGKFNVPYGRPKTDRIIDAANLRACSRALRRSGVSLRTGDFEDALTNVTAGDFVFLDPPYVTGHNNNGFIDYNEHLFEWDDQIRLARVARELRAAGVHVVITNAAHDKVLELYRGFKSREVARTSTIAGDALKRRPVTEAIIWSP
jgi:DNA adenine methylase